MNNWATHKRMAWCRYDNIGDNSVGFGHCSLLYSDKASASNVFSLTKWLFIPSVHIRRLLWWGDLVFPIRNNPHRWFRLHNTCRYIPQPFTTLIMKCSIKLSPVSQHCIGDYYGMVCILYLKTSNSQWKCCPHNTYQEFMEIIILLIE